MARKSYQEKPSSNHVAIFRDILDELIALTPEHAKQELVMQYEEDYKKRCDFIDKIIFEKKRIKNINETEEEKSLRNKIALATTSKKTRRAKESGYKENKMMKKEIVRVKIFQLLRQSEYGHLVDECTLSDVAYIFNITRERIRQIENKCILFMKNPAVLKELSKDGKIESILDHLDLALEYKKRHRR